MHATNSLVCRYQLNPCTTNRLFVIVRRRVCEVHRVQGAGRAPWRVRGRRVHHFERGYVLTRLHLLRGRRRVLIGATHPTSAGEFVNATGASDSPLGVRCGCVESDTAGNCSSNPTIASDYCLHCRRLRVRSTSRLGAALYRPHVDAKIIACTGRVGAALRV